MTTLGRAALAVTVRISAQDLSGKKSANFTMPAEYDCHLSSCGALLMCNFVQQPVRFCKNVYLGSCHCKLQFFDFYFSLLTDSRFVVLQPNRDRSLENDIIVHEMTLANHMTGGGTAPIVAGLMHDI